ncbi:scarecrow-like protein 15 [Cucurbita maxima]|uniref:Scarecrow-like protein 15 n=1 Tax=Cucurbita maxima TaxID=3661 RepID=A0A6J1J6X8_CUCMA|nr:scarecrow-like protein 15 [Cucurbita maxima]
MRVPVSNHHSSKPSSAPTPNPKLDSSPSPTAFRPPTTTATTATPGYEPTSVLDLRRSPSPVAPDNPLSSADDRHNNSHPLDWDERTLQNLDWESIMGDLGVNDDSNSALKNTTAATTTTTDDNTHDHVPHFSEFLHSQPFDQTAHLLPSDFFLSEPYSNHSAAMLHQTFDFAPNSNDPSLHFLEDLVDAADCFDSNDFHLAHVILERLNHRLQSASSAKPLHRAAFFFKEALQSLLSTSATRHNSSSSWPDIVHTIKAHKAFSAISPIPLFSHFTTNQILLEALNASSFIHIIDFDIGFGGQYASFMKEIADKAESRNVVPPVIRITAVVFEEFAVESRLTRENLCQFAQDLKLRFHIDLVPLQTFKTLSFKSVKFMEGEKVAILLTPTIFRRLGSSNGIASFLADVRLVSPCVVVFVDFEGWSDSGKASFKRNLLDSLEFYAMMLESLDAAGADGEWVRRIETFVLRPKILAAVEGAGRMAVPLWREVFHSVGMRPVALSQFADFQAECLLGKVQVRGFQVGKRHAELVLCWHERPLVATSAWRC